MIFDYLCDYRKYVSVAEIVPLLGVGIGLLWCLYWMAGVLLEENIPMNSCLNLRVADGSATIFVFQFDSFAFERNNLVLAPAIRVGFTNDKEWRRLFRHL